MESGVGQFTFGTWFICLLLKWKGGTRSQHVFIQTFCQTFSLDCQHVCHSQRNSDQCLFCHLYYENRHPIHVFPNNTCFPLPTTILTCKQSKFENHYNKRSSICLLTLMFWDSGNLQFILQNRGTFLEKRWYPHVPLPNCSDWGK